MSEVDVTTAITDLNARRLKLIGVDKDRRRVARMRTFAPVPARFGRVEGTLADISDHGARMKHREALHPCTESRLVFDWGETWFIATARVLSTWLVRSD